MNIENSFSVNAPIEDAWKVILDLERVAPCLPGASIEEAAGDEYQGTMAVKLGPISARYRGTVKVEETDEANHRVVLRAMGNETRGQGSASATITSSMSEENGVTNVLVQTDMEVTGKVAQFGRGIMQDVASELMDRFSTCVEQEIVGGGSEEAGRAPQKATTVTEESAAAQTGASTQQSPQREAQPLDLGSVSRGAVLKRAVPVLAGAGGLCLLISLVVGLRRPPSFQLIVGELEIRKR
ncbi:MAG: SRPBCC family protein [Rubrobacter sp.]|nr:SRPBCC family protein [Rubrobacter sp.]